MHRQFLALCSPIRLRIQEPARRLEDLVLLVRSCPGSGSWTSRKPTLALFWRREKLPKESLREKALFAAIRTFCQSYPQGAPPAPRDLDLLLLSPPLFLFFFTRWPRRLRRLVFGQGALFGRREVNFPGEGAERSRPPKGQVTIRPGAETGARGRPEGLPAGCDAPQTTHNYCGTNLSKRRNPNRRRGGRTSHVAI